MHKISVNSHAFKESILVHSNKYICVPKILKVQDIQIIKCVPKIPIRVSNSSRFDFRAIPHSIQEQSRAIPRNSAQRNAIGNPSPNLHYIQLNYKACLNNQNVQDLGNIIDCVPKLQWTGYLIIQCANINSVQNINNFTMCF